MLRAVQPEDFELVPDAAPVPEDDLFESFWLIYPRRVSKKKAREAWRRIDASLRVEILEAALAWRKIWLKRDELEYTPYPASWLNGEMWTDELPPDARPSHASHVSRETFPESPQRSVMPAHVVEQIARIKAGKC